MNSIDWSMVPYRVTNDTVLYTVPVVVHVLHDYGADILVNGHVTDSMIYGMIDTINKFLLKQNADTENIIPKFKPIAASTRIQFKLANFDTSGQPTHGIEYIHTYLTNYATDQSRINQWNPSRYLNLWLVNSIVENETSWIPGCNIYFPSQAATFAEYDGILSFARYFQVDLKGLTDAFAQYLGLKMACGIFGCSDNDSIPDTPPCNIDSPPDCSNLFPTECDTPNIQNLMVTVFGGTDCRNMFTYGQGIFMQATLENDVAKRDSLVTATNYLATGMNLAQTDLAPVAEFSASFALYRPETKFGFLGVSGGFNNFSWRDTVESQQWTITDGDSSFIYTSTPYPWLTVRLHHPGWVTTSLSVTGNNTGSSVKTDSFSLYVADTVPTNAVNYYQEFTDPASYANWPMFNYFNNDFKWQITNVGYWDNTCLMYNGFDNREFPAKFTGSPAGDYDDFFTPVFDLSEFIDSLYLNFMTSGAALSKTAVDWNNPANWHDSLQIYYSNSAYSSGVWHQLATIKGADLENSMGKSAAWVPNTADDWVSRAFSIPHSIRNRHFTLRFRYFPGADSAGYSSGNNFFIDRINFNVFPQKVAETLKQDVNMYLYPNPAASQSNIYVQSSNYIGQVSITVIDVSGRQIISFTSQVGNSSGTIPLPTIPVGVYVVRLSCNNFSATQKLVVE